MWFGQPIDPESPGYFAAEQSLADPYGLGCWLRGGLPGNDRPQRVLGKDVHWRLKVESISPEGVWICTGGDKQRIEVTGATSPAPPIGLTILISGRLMGIRENSSDFDVTVISWKGVSQ